MATHQQLRHWQDQSRSCRSHSRARERHRGSGDQRHTVRERSHGAHRMTTGSAASGRARWRCCVSSTARAARLPTCRGTTLRPRAVCIGSGRAAASVFSSCLSTAECFALVSMAHFATLRRFSTRRRAGPTRTAMTMAPGSHRCAARRGSRQVHRDHVVRRQLAQPRTRRLGGRARLQRPQRRTSHAPPK